MVKMFLAYCETSGSLDLAGCLNTVDFLSGLPSELYRGTNSLMLEWFETPTPLGRDAGSRESFMF